MRSRWQVPCRPPSRRQRGRPSRGPGRCAQLAVLSHPPGRRRGGPANETPLGVRRSIMRCCRQAVRRQGRPVAVSASGRPVRSAGFPSRTTMRMHMLSASTASARPIVPCVPMCLVFMARSGGGGPARVWFRPRTTKQRLQPGLRWRKSLAPRKNRSCPMPPQQIYPPRPPSIPRHPIDHHPPKNLTRW